MKLLKSKKLDEIVDRCWELGIDVDDIPADLVINGCGGFDWKEAHAVAIEFGELITQASIEQTPIVDVCSMNYRSHLFFLGTIKEVKAKIQQVLDDDLEAYGPEETR